MTLKKYVKKASHTVEAMPLAITGCELEYDKWGGRQQAREGDWLVNADGEFYTVEQQSFAETYQQVSGNRYRKIAPVWAEQAQQAGDITTKEGKTHYRTGDFIVYNHPDKTDGYAVTESVFSQTYQPAAEETQMLAQDYIEQRLDDQINWYEAKSAFNQQRFKWFQLSAIIFGAAIPLLTAISFEELEVVMRFTIALLGSLIAITNAVLSLNKYQENWVQYRGSAEALLREKYLFLTRSAPYAEDDTVNFRRLVERCEGIMSSENTSWIKLTTPETEADITGDQKTA